MSYQTIALLGWLRGFVGVGNVGIRTAGGAPMITMGLTAWTCVNSTFDVVEEVTPSGIHLFDQSNLP